MTLGYIFFELGYFQQAIGYFRDISQAHESYYDALLGIGWSAIKLEDYQRAIPPLTKLVQQNPTAEHAEEAYFLLGQCYLKLGRYDEAIAMYERIIDLFPNESILPRRLKEVNNSLTDEERKIEQMKVRLLMLESKLLNILPLISNDVPHYLKEESKRLQQERDNLISELLKEKEIFAEISRQIAYLKELVARKTDRRSWRGYAEYGKARALFLKGME